MSDYLDALEELSILPDIDDRWILNELRRQHTHPEIVKEFLDIIRMFRRPAARA
jgi:hypothetical protein